MNTLLRLPDVFKTEKVEISEEEWNTLLSCTRQAIKGLNEFRVQEGKALENLIDDLAEPVERMEFRMNISEENFREYGSTILSDLEGYAKRQDGWNMAPDNYEGIRISFGKGDGEGFT
jgi:uncharacterized protein YicC (UPF0701 family)